MPIYEYLCEDCGETVERVLSIATRDSLTACHKCHKQMKRVITCKIERLEPTYLDEMKQMLPPHERTKVYDRCSFRKALDRSGLVTT